MKKIVALLLVVAALAVAAPSFAQNHGANSYENQMTPSEYGKMFKLLGQGFCDGVKWIGKEMDKRMKGFGQGGYMGPHDPSSIDSQNTQKAAPVKQNTQKKQEAKPQQKKETPKTQKTGKMGSVRSSQQPSAGGKAYLKNRIKRAIFKRNIA